MQNKLCDCSLWLRGVSLLPRSAHPRVSASEGCTESCLSVCWMMRLAKQLRGWQTAPSLAASPWWLCLQNILSVGLLVTSPSLHQCLRLAKLYTRGAVSFHTGEPAKSLPGVIVTSQQRFANRHSEIKSWCRAKGQ